MTAAEIVAAILPLVAGAFASWVYAWHGAWAVVPLLGAGAALSACQVVRSLRARRGPRVLLEHRPDGSLWLVQGASPAVPVVLGAGTRLLGPSVFLDLRLADRGRMRRRRLWITRWDVPAEALRRWSVVLPRTGRAACA